jgi:hypothetical protein
LARLSTSCLDLLRGSNACWRLNPLAQRFSCRSTNGYTDDAENYATTFVTDDLDWSLALEVHPRLIAALTQSDSGIQYEDFGITHHGDLPAILTEATFITSSDEACNFLGNQSRIRAEALALFHGIVAYFVATLSELAATGTRLVGGRCPPH